MRVLCLDIEGGFGGSSRSLFELVRHMDRADLSVEVWCKRAGPIQARYAEIGVPTRVEPNMPKVSSLPRLSRNLFAYGRFLADWWRSRVFRRRLLEATRGRFDLVHFNHESLFVLARWLKRFAPAATCLHVRTNPHDSVFARWQARVVARAADRLVFITENERETLTRRVCWPVSGDVIYNPVSALEVSPHPLVPRDGRLRLASLSNYSYQRGTDRLIEVAEVLAQRKRRDALFVIAGTIALRGTLPGELGALARTGGTLADLAARRGVADMFCFLGHVPEPERVLAACDALVKPTREANPWGRDILEAMVAGKPVISIGTYNRFVEHEVTGVLHAEYGAEALADAILRLHDDRPLLERLGSAARDRVAVLCRPEARASDLEAVWFQAVRQHTGR